jgi:hypothetical protein
MGSWTLILKVPWSLGILIPKRPIGLLGCFSLDWICHFQLV